MASDNEAGQFSSSLCLAQVRSPITKWHTQSNSCICEIFNMSSEYAFTYWCKLSFCCIHKVVEFTSWNVVRIFWNEFQLNEFLEEFPCVSMGLPFLLPHCPPPCGSVTLQIGLGKFHSRMSPNFGDMKVVFHFCKPSIHNLPILNPIKIPRLNGLESHIFRWSSFEGCNQLSEIGPIHFE